MFTDGDIRELYELREIGGKEIMKVQLTKVVAGEAARALLTLWRPTMPAVEVGPSPVVQPLPPPPPPPGLVSLDELERQMKDSSKEQATSTRSFFLVGKKKNSEAGETFCLPLSTGRRAS